MRIYILGDDGVWYELSLSDAVSLIAALRANNYIVVIEPLAAR